jgi:hypothetical protein
MNPYPHNQRMLDLLKSLDDVDWPTQVRFVICFNGDPEEGLVSDDIKTATLSIWEKSPPNDDSADPVPLSLGLRNIPVGHC